MAFDGIPQPGVGMLPLRVWRGTATTDGSGAWSVTFPANTFTLAPQVFPQAVSADATLPNQAVATLTAQSGAGASGMVTLPATIQALGGLPVKAAGSGLVVNVVAVGS